MFGTWFFGPMSSTPCARDAFHVWALDHVDQGLELLSGIPAGEAQQEKSFHGSVAQRLEQMAAVLKEQRATIAERGASVLQLGPERQPDPRPPLPGTGGILHSPQSEQGWH